MREPSKNQLRDVRQPAGGCHVAPSPETQATQLEACSLPPEAEGSGSGRNHRSWFRAKDPFLALPRERSRPGLRRRLYRKRFRRGCHSPARTAAKRIVTKRKLLRTTPSYSAFEFLSAAPHRGRINCITLKSGRC